MAYYTVVHKKDFQPEAATDAQAVRWFSLTNLPTLAFDHTEILEKAIELLNQYVFVISEGVTIIKSATC